MKRFIIIAASASLFASCAVTKTHTAKTAEIESGITQMPTVVELDVAQERASSDTFEWQSKFFSFKRRASVKEKTQEAVAQILERTGADVLVEPKVSVDCSTRPFVTDYSLSVSGYPAKYAEFRTATLGDIETVNALRKPAAERTVRLADYIRPQTAALPRKTRNTIAVADAVTKKERWVRKSGYMGMIDAGVNIGLSNEDIIGIQVSTTHGALIAHRFFVGLGLGYNWETNLNEDADIEYDVSTLFPYFNLRAYMLKRRVSPFVDARVGYAYAVNNHHKGNGLYCNAGIGLSVGRFNLSANFCYFANHDYRRYSYTYGDKFEDPNYKHLGGITVKVGVTF